ncbi:Peptidase M23B [Sulfurimonas denitrificans DSM 1251]|uniref:Peptidase M23B n=2 Tax=Sulfurimonas denitrificans TaxID=39766 RepID=Q30ST1_SULDN|nr:Peptidase M23B [Sulfurimonas denitrificans DSM 1251]
MYNSLIFEREAPAIALDSDGYWNLKDPLKLSIQDVSGLKSYKVTLKSSSEDTVLYHEQFMEAKSPIELKIESPKSAYTMKDKEIKIVVEALDASKWNFFQGNSTQREYSLKIDKKRPLVSIIGNSYKISKGGSALVIFKIEDENLKDFYIETNFDKKFKAQPFYKEGYYIALLAWPIMESNFKATVVVEDYAKNTTQVYIPLYLREKSYKVSNIKLSDSFLKGKIAELAEEFEETQGVTDSIEQFKLINETVRLKNESLIHEITSKVPQKMVQDFHINSMYPLKNGAVVAHFGDHRIYSYNDKDVSESYHMGLDLASNAQAEIRPQNGGEVVYSEYNGLYGNMPIISHGLGLYTLYGHCSSIVVNNGDVVGNGAHIANTGKSGYAMGDHLHFGVLVQGIEVHPAEWMDDEWMKLNITDIIKSAKDIIDKKI